jgi:hypothetical protein
MELNNDLSKKISNNDYLIAKQKSQASSDVVKSDSLMREVDTNSYYATTMLLSGCYC